MNFRVRKLHPSARLPTYATDGSGCFDLYAATVEGSEHAGAGVYPDAPVTCQTGLAFEVPEGHVMLVFSRSGHGFNQGVRLANCVGVIDADYRGEVAVKLTADEIFVDPESFACDRHRHLRVTPGSRIAQALIVPIPRVEFEEVDELSATARGTGGFGSTGA